MGKSGNHVQNNKYVMMAYQKMIIMLMLMIQRILKTGNNKQICYVRVNRE